jgi:hypothetical protein
MPGRHHDPITNQCAAGEAAQLLGVAGLIDAPHHDHADVRVPVVLINGYLARERR